MNIGRLPVLSRALQLGLYEHACQECRAFDLCGGTDTAPCLCVHNAPSRRKDCDACDVYCRERTSVGGICRPNAFEDALEEGLPLQLLRLSRGPEVGLPAFVPTRTDELHRAVRLPIPWVGVDAKSLLTRHRGKPRYSRAFARRGPAFTRSYLRVEPNTKVLAVLNARDQVLEGMWGASLPSLAAQLMQAGITAATGPTFSVYDDLPSSHSVVMMLRHHSTCHELHAAGLSVCPNLYWRDLRDREAWIAWLRREESLNLVSRDFSAVKGSERQFRFQLAGLLEVLEGVPRKLHVVLVGIGMGRIAAAVAAIRSVGCTATVVSGEPVLQAIKEGRALTLATSDRPTWKPAPDQPRRRLAARNVQVARAFLERIGGGQQVETPPSGSPGDAVHPEGEGVVPREAGRRTGMLPLNTRRD